ncbi:MAG: VIT family protein [Thermomicrobiales bacterium]|nr:VIT family protein [Thermomicrobiales bacterium]
MARDHATDQEESLGNRLNWLRAGVLGANDGIVSVAGVVVGVAGATSNREQILTAGVAALVAGALSMAGGEYVSVSTQRDTEKAAIATEREELREDPEAELDELASHWQSRGLSAELARDVAEELTAKDALRAHVEVEFNLTPGELTNPWHAAFASLLAFGIGAAIPVVAIGLFPDGLRIWVCVAAVVVALLLTGLISARLGNANAVPAIRRNVLVGTLTMATAWLIGRLFEVAIT